MAQRPGLKSLRLVNYKGFNNHTISFKQTNVLVGANNAGKTTALGALRLLAAMLPQARRLSPNGVGEVEGRVIPGWPITAAAIETSGFSHENIRYDFRPQETRIEALTTTGVRLVASWANMEDYDPDERPPTGTFFVFPPDGGKILQPRAAAKDLVPDIAVVPMLTPLDDREALFREETLRRNRSSRRSSRFFRNTLHSLDATAWIDFTSFVYESTPEITELNLNFTAESPDDAFDLYYKDEDRRSEREIGWAGDGMQIWLQVLYHLWRQRSAPVVILDEPDVFLHPDLQRRLARIIFAANQQSILATHSVEMLAEAEPGSAVWVDRSRRSAERPRGDGALALMGRRLGSGFELGVGRALRSRVAFFVEGDDAPVLGHLARRAGHTNIAAADGYATISLGGFSRHSVAGAFAEGMAALGADVRTFVLLDGDLRCEEVRDAETAELEDAGATVHIWERRELENYLLVPSAIAKVSGFSLDDAQEMLDAVTDDLRGEAQLTLQSTRLEERGRKGSSTGNKAPKTVLQAAEAEFAERWATAEGRLGVIDAKRAIHELNRRIQQKRGHSINPHSLAKSVPVAEVHREVREVVDRLARIVATQ